MRQRPLQLCCSDAALAANSQQLLFFFVRCICLLRDTHLSLLPSAPSSHVRRDVGPSSATAVP